MQPTSCRSRRRGAPFSKSKELALDFALNLVGCEDRKGDRHEGAKDIENPVSRTFRRFSTRGLFSSPLAIFTMGRSLSLAAATAAAALSASRVAAQDAVVSIAWGETIATSKSTPALQIVVNPLWARDSPVHDQILASLAGLEADYVRMVRRKEEGGRRGCVFRKRD